MNQNQPMAEKQEVTSGGAAPMCANDCGFFSNTATKNFCSKCYKDLASKAATTALIEEKTSTTRIHSDTSSSKTTVVTTSVAEEVKEESLATAMILCVGGCSFFESAETKNMCSKCCFGSIKAVNAAPKLLEEKIKAAPTITAEELPVPAAQEATTPAVEAPKAVLKRCVMCRKKVGLLGFACRCGGTFCSVHRYAKKHTCDFDFKKADWEQITKNNPLVVAPKINKI